MNTRRRDGEGSAAPLDPPPAPGEHDDDMSRLFVAVGDSFTEGVGDPHLHYPNRVRGWADRLARQLGRADPTWRYANLAIRSKFLDRVVADQLEPALALDPTHISFCAGGNDLLALRADVDGIADRYEQALLRLVGSGAEVIAFTTFVPRASGLLKPLVRRVDAFNAAIRDLAATHDVTLVDHDAMREFDDRGLWALDRIHLSRPGHKRMAARVAQTLGGAAHPQAERPRAPRPARMAARDAGRGGVRPRRGDPAGAQAAARRLRG
uniref:SGNH/GDSL hydrolase family protein n=1 Tax=Janibacter limosus TaxID=53458 RepID=A0AC61U3P7_9MICO|nr:SGNH/GDSL hydrolase family protein [Janibacter limosus]